MLLSSIQHSTLPPISLVISQTKLISKSNPGHTARSRSLLHWATLTRGLIIVFLLIMDCSEHPTGSGRRSPRREVQGPRPTPLKVRKDSDKFKKPPQYPPQLRPPVIIYTVSPKVIHTNPSDFMSLVQRLTGAAASSTTTSVASETEPKLATIEKPMPLPRRDNDVLNPLGFDDGATCFNHAGILSPVPASLPAISPNFFSPPAVDISNSLSLLPDLSPGIFSGNHKNYADNSFLISPGNLLSSHIAPTPSGYWDLFNQYDQGL